MSKKESNDTGQEETEQGSATEPEIVDAEIIENTPEQPTAVATTKTGGGKVAIVLALIAIVVALGGLGYGYQLLKGQQDEMAGLQQALSGTSEKNQSLEGKLAATQSAFDQQKQQIEAQRNSLQAQDAKLEQERERLSQQGLEMKQTLDAVYRRVGRSSTAWMAAEAEYLMRVANHRLQLEQDVNTAIQALNAADERLRDTGDLGWTPVRELVAEEIASLKAIGSLDRSGLSAKLTSLAKQAKGLKMVGLEYSPAKPMPAKADENSDARSIKTMLDDGWKGFKSLMVIRHRDKPVAAMLAPDQQFFVYQNLELQLEAARMAMLRGDKVLFETSLQMTERWIGDFFDAEARATQAIVAELQALRQTDIRPALPDISRSLLALTERQKAAEAEGSDQ